MDTKVLFYLNIKYKFFYLYFLIKKLFLLKNKIIIYNKNIKNLKYLDNLLWTLSDIDFIPHTFLNDKLLKFSSIILTNNENIKLKKFLMLINLDNNVPKNFKNFKNIIEILSKNKNDTIYARKRYILYKKHGCLIKTIF